MAYIWRGDLTGFFLHYEFGGLIFGGAYTWRGLISEFYGSSFRCFLKEMNKVPLLPVITGTFLGLLRMSNIMGLCTHGMRKWVPSPLTSGLTP